jgi:hypothetical protein
VCHTEAAGAVVYTPPKPKPRTFTHHLRGQTWCRRAVWACDASYHPRPARVCRLASAGCPWAIAPWGSGSLLAGILGLPPFWKATTCCPEGRVFVWWKKCNERVRSLLGVR